MSMPNMPDIHIDREYALNILIASVGLEELALAHILNAEGEKIQYVLGTLDNRDPGDITICDVLEVNKSVERTLRNAIKMEMLLQFKMEDAYEFIDEQEYTSFAFLTVDEDTGLPLTGAKYELRKNGVLVSTATSGTDGFTKFSHLLKGVYTLKQIEAPAGYLVDTNIYAVEVLDDGTVTIDGKAIEDFIVLNKIG